MKDIDREFITSLSPLVPIIPIIGKSDTMTSKERQIYLESVQSKLNELTERFGDKCIYDFEGDDLTDVTSNGSSSPNKTANINGQRIPNIFACVCDSSRERIYPWGTLNIENPLHSDFRRLQSIIFENGMYFT